MKTLVTFLPWWSAVLLFANVAGSFAALWLRRKHGAFPALTMLRVFLWYSGVAGLLGFAAICVTPVGSWFYWYAVSAINVLYDVLLFLLCAQLIDHAIHRKAVRTLKALWLTLCPSLLGIAIVWGHIYPFARMRQSINFDGAFAVTCGAVMLYAVQKPRDLAPDEPWIGDYALIVCGLGIQLAALWSMRFFRFPSMAAEVTGPLASLGMLSAFALAAVRKTGAARIES